MTTRTRLTSDTTKDAGAVSNGSTTIFPPGYEQREPGVDFSKAVSPNGYLWWYVDAISDDGQQALTMIVFVGSVFSPYYARARRRGLTEAQDHCAFNTILYGPGKRKHWSMTERSAKTLRRDQNHYSLGPSSLDWDGTHLHAQIDERCVPMPRRMQGSIKVTPSVMTEHTLLLDEHGRHRWHPLSPIARVEVNFPSLNVQWSGHGYMDCNEGNEPLADGFTGWDWARNRLPDGDCAVRYETRTPMQQPRRLALRFAPDGSIKNEETSNAVELPQAAVWRMPQRMPGTPKPVQLVRTLEDTPFYTRSLIESAEDEDSHASGFHESLSMERFQQRWVQTLLPFRMPRRG
ncbi:MAG: carotenoid 1,2-hydratase [Congregibacter sp.]